MVVLIEHLDRQPGGAHRIHHPTEWCCHSSVRL
jgi:hypothetical protein